MPPEAIISIAGIAGTALFFALLFLPDILKSWHEGKLQAANAEAEAANAALKREMVAQGFTADEIARVINAGPGTRAEPKAEGAGTPPVTADHR
jgi:hypothetical protein